MITDAPGLNWVGPGDAWTRAWAQPQSPPQLQFLPPMPTQPPPPLLDPAVAVAVIPLAAPASSAEPDVVLVRRTLAAVEPVADRAVAHFYAVLFVRNPELRALFPAAMDVQRDRLFRALLAAARVAEDPTALTALLEPLARGHRKYGVRNEHYPPVGAALLAALERYCGRVWDRHTEAAWRRVYEAVSQVMIEAAEQDATVSPPWWQAEVLAVEPLTEDIAQVAVRTDHPYPYRAGQYAMLEVPRWPRVWRPYSLACAPRGDGVLTFQVKAVPAGWVSNALVRRTDRGDVLRLGPPSGTMVLQPDGRAPLLMLGGGTGIAPVLALVEELAAQPQPPRRTVEVVYGARRTAELYALARLTELAKRHSWLSVEATVTEGTAPGGLRGSLPEIVADRGPWEDYEAYLSGPPAMVRRGVRALYAAGVAGEHIRHDLGDEDLT
jgi:NAD(P)H-flavin reductase/hemoglobin-like flavoprotein